MADLALYVCRRVINVDKLSKWISELGHPLLSTRPLDDKLHVTQVYSKNLIPWDSLADQISARPVSLGILGEDNAVVLYLDCPEMYARWSQSLDEGAVWKFDDYNPHMTLFYLGDSMTPEIQREIEDLADVVPDFDLILGPELVEIKGGS